MENEKTISETLFERFLANHQLAVERVPVAASPRPDYLVSVGTSSILFEVKELTADDNFGRGPHRLSTRTIGDHVRSKISESKKQMQYGATQGIASVLLIYNAIDPVHMFGTENHDFRTAMHGEWTLRLSDAGQVVAAGYGRNRSLREDQNTSFSALGHLVPSNRIMTVRLFVNEHAKFSLPPNLPPCFELA